MGDPDVTLNSYIVSPTAYETVSWWSDGMTKQDFEDCHVYLQKEDQSTYMERIIASAGSYSVD